MEDAFKKLERDGQNSVDNLILWMKESKVIDNAHDAEAKARKLFDDTSNKQHVELNKFKQVLNKLAVQQRRSVEDMSRALSEHTDKMARALQSAADAAADAFSRAMSKKR